MKIRWLAALAAIALGCIPAKAQGPVINDPANGLTQTFSSGSAIVPGQIVKLNGNGQVIPVTTSDTAAPIGIAATGANGQFQTIIVSIGGTQNVLVDAACTIGQKVQISATNAGYGDCSASPSLGIVGLALTASASLGKVSVQLQIGGSSSSGSSFPVTAPQSVGNGGSISVPPGTSGSIAGVQVASPVMATYFANTCPTSNTSTCFYTPANLRFDNTCNWSSTTLNCTDAPFTSAAVNNGMSIIGAASFASDAEGAAGGQIATTTNVTITFVSTTQVTLSAGAANSCAANCSVGFGNLDDANAVTLDTAINALTYCTRLEFASSNYFYSSPHHYTNPPACAALGAGQGTYGTITLSSGYSIVGRGRGATNIVLNTNFPNGDACTHKSSTGQSTGGCFAVPLMGDWTDFTITGGNQTTAANMNSKALITMSVGEIDRFDCLNMGWQNASNMVGINISVLARLISVDNAGCGTIGIQNESGGTAEGANLFYNVLVENSSTNAILVLGTGAYDTITSFGGDYAMPQLGLTAGEVIRNSGGGTLKFFGGLIQPTNAPTSTNTGISGYRCITAAANAYFDGVTFTFTTANGATGTAVWLNGTGCKAYLNNSQILATKTGATAFSDFGSTSGTQFSSLGGNTISGPVSITAGGDLITAPTDNLSAASSYGPTSCSSTGLAQSACAFVTGSTNSSGTIRVTAGGVGGAFTETLNFLGSFTGPTGNPATCQFMYANTGTGTWTAPALLTLTSKSATAQTISGTATTVNASTYDMNYSCVPQ